MLLLDYSQEQKIKQIMSLRMTLFTDTQKLEDCIFRKTLIN